MFRVDFQSLLLIQAGTPPDDIRAIAGDLPQWFLAAIGCESETIDIVKVYEGEPLPKPGQPSKCRPAPRAAGGQIFCADMKVS